MRRKYIGWVNDRLDTAQEKMSELKDMALDTVLKSNRGKEENRWAQHLWAVGQLQASQQGQEGPRRQKNNDIL